MPRCNTAPTNAVGMPLAWASFLEPSEQVLGGGEVLVAVQGALQHLTRFFVIALPMANVAEVEKHLGLGDRRAVVELLQEKRAEGLLSAIEMRACHLLVDAGRQIERQHAEVTEDCNEPGVDLECDVELLKGLVLLALGQVGLRQSVVDRGKLLDRRPP